MTKSLDDSTPMQCPAASTTGAPEMLDLDNLRAASRSEVPSGMVTTGLIIRSAAVKAKSDFAAARLVAARTVFSS